MDPFAGIRLKDLELIRFLSLRLPNRWVYFSIGYRRLGVSDATDDWRIDSATKSFNSISILAR